MKFVSCIFVLAFFVLALIEWQKKKRFRRIAKLDQEIRRLSHKGLTEMKKKHQPQRQDPTWMDRTRKTKVVDDLVGKDANARAILEAQIQQACNLQVIVLGLAAALALLYGLFGLVYWAVDGPP